MLVVGKVDVLTIIVEMRKGQEELGHQRDPETICTIFLVPIFLHIFLSADIYVKKKNRH